MRYININHWKMSCRKYRKVKDGTLLIYKKIKTKRKSVILKRETENECLTKPEQNQFYNCGTLPNGGYLEKDCVGHEHVLDERVYSAKVLGNKF